MKVLLAFAGSRGDAQPGVLLGRELAARGHDVTLAVSPNLVGFADRYGVSAVPFGLDSDEMLRAQRDDRRFRHPNPGQRVRAVLELQRRGFAEAADDLLALAGGSEALVTGMACEEAAAEVARHHGIPIAAVHFFPIEPNRSVPVIPAAWGRHLPGTLNRLGWKALTVARAWSLEPERAAFRRTAARGSASRTSAVHAGGFEARARPEDRAPGSGRGGSIPPLVDRAGRRTPAYTAIQAYDPALFPGLADELRDMPFTGFPVAAEDGAGRRAPEWPEPGTSAVEEGGPRLGAELLEWLIAGPAPVYAGFGSMPVAEPVAVESLVREVGRRLGRRILLVGPMFRGRIDDELAVVDQVDHRAVLPLCDVAVHHGGAGTTAAVLRAGVPSVICSVQADQSYWGRQVEALGLGATAPFAGLTANRLERLLIRASRPDVRLRAAAYGARFRGDGVARAADAVETLLPQATTRSPGAEGLSIPTGGYSASTMIGGAR
ncbi:glycosyltransferase [Nocardia sp. NPDC056611]|uniref:glycosyltransferase n=1 Tax=Nocardia sp. NPDC056611 TaxID=3345877 RepID=UPI00366B527C